MHYRKTALSGSLALIVFIGFWGCLHDTGIALENDRPQPSMQIIVDTLFYPDSTICTLTVTDRNDNFLSYQLCSGNYPLSTDTGYVKQPDLFTCDAPGVVHAVKIRPLKQTIRDKKYEYIFGGDRLGPFEGVSRFMDEHDEEALVPIAVQRTFTLPFDNYPLRSDRWKPYASVDSMRMGFEWNDRKLRFIFGTDSLACSDEKVGIRSTFRVCDEFDVSIDFELRDDLYDGFNLAFFVSADADTGRWGSNRAGIYVRGGEENRVRVQAQSTNFQIAGRELPFFSGRLRIQRLKDRIVFRCMDADPFAGAIVFDENFTFDAPECCYVHLVMEVSDFKRVRHCSWNNFRCENGRIILPEN